MSNYRDWEIPKYREDEASDKSGFQRWIQRDGIWSPPLYIWLDDGDIHLSNTSDPAESIQLVCAQDVDDLISRLRRAKADVFGKTSGMVKVPYEYAHSDELTAAYLRGYLAVIKS